MSCATATRPGSGGGKGAFRRSFTTAVCLLTALFSSSVGLYWLILLVPAFSFFLSLWNLQPFRSKELSVMVIIAIIGFITNRLATIYIRLSRNRALRFFSIVSAGFRSSTAPTLSPSLEPL